MHITSYFSQIVHSFPDLIAAGGYWLLSVIVFFEGLPILGSFIPGHLAIICAGFLAKFNILNLFIVIIVCIISSAIADIIGFFVGKRMGYQFLQRLTKYVFLKEHHIEKAKKIIENHTGKAIIIGKFSPVTRPLIPYMVGANGIHPKTFWFYNILGGSLWVYISVIVGYMFGASYDIGAKYLGEFFLLAFIASILILWGYRFVNLRFHIFKKYEIFVLILNLLSVWVLAKTIQDGLSISSFMKNFDIWANLLSSEYANPLLTKISFITSSIGGTIPMISIGLIIGLYFMYKHKWRRGTIMLFSILSTSASVLFLKEIFLRSRPNNALQILTDPSFPSGHAALSAAFFLSLAYIVVPKIKNWVKRESVIVLCFLCPFLIGLSRIVLNVHWVSDVIAGWAIGIFLSTGGILLIRYIGSIFLKKEVLDNNGLK